MKADLLDIIQAGSNPWPISEIRRVLARRGHRLPEHELLEKLRDLLRDGQVEYVVGRWRGVATKQVPACNTDRIILPKISLETQQLLGQGSSSHPSAPGGPIDDTPPLASGPWGGFRVLLQYYRDCIRNEGGAEALANLNELHEKYLFLSRLGHWLPHPGAPWRHAIPLGRHLGPFVQHLSKAGQDAFLVLGYPLQVIQWQREGEPDAFLLKPVFHYALEHELSQGALLLQTNHPHAQINLDWLQHTFKEAVNRHSFLSACGFLGGDDDEASPASRSSPAIEHLTTTLATFLSRNLQEPLLPDGILSTDFRQPLKTGIYNRAVIMLARRPQYTKTLLKELAAIAESPDRELDKTALRFLFRADLIQDQSSSAITSSKSVPAADVTSLNSEQRDAVKSLINKPITVITGPPGTGKSQVVSAAIANIHLHGLTVLFTSRNHKAIDAVHDRCRSKSGQSLLVRCNSKEDPSLRESFTTAIGRLLTGQSDDQAIATVPLQLVELRQLLDARTERLKQLEVFRAYRERLGDLEEQLLQLANKLSAAVLVNLQRLVAPFPEAALFKIEEAARLIHDPNRALSPWQAWPVALAAIPAWVNLGRSIQHFSDLPAPTGLFCTPSRIKSFRQHLELLRTAAGYYARLSSRKLLEEEVAVLQSEAVLVSEIAAGSGQIVKISAELLELLIAARKGLPAQESRELYANLRSSLGYLDQGTAPANLQREVKDVFRMQLPKLLEHYPAWAVTSLSVGSRIPLLPGIFDLVVIDEASQSDIPSSIPLLFRARRAGVVGDPQQLTHVTTLSRAKDTMLRRRVGLDRLAQQRFSFVESSLYSLFADTDGVSPILLCETYRSVEEIAGYSNDLFYGGSLRVATDTSRLAQIPGMKLGVHWDEVAGEVRSGGMSGAFCDEEIEMTTNIVRGILNTPSFKGSLGVVTPFREQANRLRDAIFDGNIPWENLRSAQVIVDTSHGFQGDERDIILFSLCAGPGMPQGGLHFLRETGNLFNVAVSRARAVVRVIGNRSWAKKCGIRHIERLAMPLRSIVHSPVESPWAPHESPWEKRLAEAMTAHGLSPIPQHPVAGRRLDLALIRETPRPLKIDIEVDGACCHRNPDGTRKKEDLWRDVQLQGLGWQVMRFWVYQLREDMEGCVQKIIHQWRNGREHTT